MKTNRICPYLLLSIFCICVTAHADSTAISTPSDKAIPAAIDGTKPPENKLPSELKGEETKEDIAKINNAISEEFWTNFGVCLLINKDLGSNKPPKKARVVEGIVRVEEENDVKYGMGLEVHKFMWGWSYNDKKKGDFSSSMAIGPYVAILPGAQEVFDVIGAGVIFGFFGGNKPDDKKTGRWSMNIAVGGYMDPDTEVLAKHFIDGQHVPHDETEVVLKKITQYGLQGMLSFSTTF